MSNWMEQVVCLCKQLNEANIVYCLLRQPKEALDSEAPGDIDLLIRPDDLECLYEVLGKSYEIRGISYIQTHAQVVIAGHNSGVPLKLDLHCHLFCGFSGGLFPLNIESEVLRQRYADGVIYRPNPVHHITLLTFHALLDKGGVVMEHIPIIRGLLSKLAESKQNVILFWTRWIPRHTASRLWKVLELGCAKQLSFIRLRLKLAFWLRQPISGMLRYPKVQIRARGYLRRWPLSRPLTIAFIGPDGVGKSTLASKLEAHGLAVTQYMGGRAALLPTTRWIQKYYRGNGDSKGNSPGETAPCGQQQKSKTESKKKAVDRLKNITTRPAIRLNNYIELWARYIYAVYRRQSLPIIFDRYPYDQCIWAQISRKDSFLKRLQCNVIIGCFPTPDILVRLHAPIRMLRDRKQEQSVEHLVKLDKACRDFCHKICSSRPIALIELDTQNDLAVTIEALNVALDRYKLLKLVDYKWV